MDKSTRIFSEDSEGRLVAMRPGAPSSEDDLQDLIARFPEIVSAGEGELLLIQREKGIPDGLSGSDRWSLDHLFVTHAAVPVLIEVKRASDTRIRREVIGQILDYAANGVVHWPAGTLEQAFLETCAARGVDADAILEAFLGDQTPSEFWSQVQANLVAGRLKLIIAADIIPPELARVVEFLNDQMRADVRAVELRYFLSDDGRRTLVPRFIGETEKSRVAKGASTTVRPAPMAVGDWIEQRLLPHGDDAVRGARAFVEMMEGLGAEVVVASTHGSLRAVVMGDDGVKVRPLNLHADARVSVGLADTFMRQGLVDEAVRRSILDEVAVAVGGVSTNNLQGYPSFPVARLNEPEVAERFESAAVRFVRLARQAA